ncbi:aldehyde dehydrogenase family protein [Cupriavidus sp. LEh21]|nr:MULTISPECIES: aldehyde dehydrogenase family protein [unclassified Cupriavidus]MDK2657624.1 aldehyde dehydrogenase family protein [Cupriavidus sp. LEh21]
MQRSAARRVWCSAPRRNAGAGSQYRRSGHVCDRRGATVLGWHGRGNHHGAAGERPSSGCRRKTGGRCGQAGGEDSLCGGDRVGAAGYFLRANNLDDVPISSEIMVQEPFGPVVAMRSFARLEDAIAEANRLPFGLAAYGFTRSLKTMHELARDLEAGMIWLNQPALALPEMPFGGVKDSGFGSEGGPEALDAYSVVKSVSTAMV